MRAETSSQTEVLGLKIPQPRHESDQPFQIVERDALTIHDTTIEKISVKVGGRERDLFVFSGIPDSEVQQRLDAVDNARGKLTDDASEERLGIRPSKYVSSLATELVTAIKTDVPLTQHDPVADPEFAPFVVQIAGKRLFSELRPTPPHP